MGRTYREQTIKLLFGTATHCAYPGCATKLIFKDRELFTPTAQIAHIRSEKENGPRHDPGYDGKKINDFENLILLCGQHHPPVDQHESAYTTEELLEWKHQQSQQGERQVADAELAAIERKLNKETPITSDAVLRGPIASLDQSERLRQAEDRLVENPLEAAVLFDEVATSLEHSPFIHHASIIRSRQCAALEKGEDYLEAAKLRVDLGWRSYFAADPFAVGQHLEKTNQYVQHLTPDTGRAVQGLSYAAAFGYQRQIAIDDLAAAFDQMQPPDQGALHLAVVLAEESITWRRKDLIVSRVDALSALAATTGSDEAGLTTKARIFMCLAESNDDWAALVRDARLVYSPSVAAWIHARYARHLTLIGKVDESIQRWQDAIDGAVAAHLNDSAADWLYALRSTRMLYWINNGDPNDLHRLAQALRAAGNGSVLPEPYPLAERAASRMLDRKWPDALQCLHQQLKHAVVSASLAAEITTHERFGDLFVATEKWHDAPKHYMYSARTNKLQKLAKAWPDEALNFREVAGEAPHWERRAAYEFAAIAGKSFPQEIARNWAESASEEVASSPATNSPLSTWMPAFKAFAACADEATVGVAENFLDLTEGYFRRNAGTHWRTDEPLVKALAKISQNHESLKNRVLRMLCDAIVVGYEVGQQVLSECEEALREDPATVQTQLSGAASEGNINAAISLIIAGCDSAPAFGLAREKLEQYTQPLEILPGVMNFEVGQEDAAILITVLDELGRQEFVDAMLARMLEVGDIDSNRASAIEAIRIVGPTLASDARAALFETLLEFSRSPSGSVASMSYGDDPFSRFKVTVGELPLGPIAVRAAGKVAHASYQYEVIQRLALTLLPSASNSACRALTLMFRGLPDDELIADVEMLAAHPNPWPRCFAAVAWSRNPSKWPGLGERLAADKDPGVRLALARTLGNGPERESVIRLLRQDYRRDIQRLVE
ncbi:HNH endonuclease signature motif containing protein [Streptomyces phaeochromogenes]|uniref:HNH endonuclease signature motif containing protein n=1 Tax=Streptomyces phaeochromogenes TaxID=1923 RepID=UPI003869DEF3|nr:HNH endonuclease [Streptomyces phaeochromogenes]